MLLRALSPADRPTSLAGPMQLPQPTAEIPELGGLLPSRLSALAEQGVAARREVDALLGRARRRARGLARRRAGRRRAGAAPGRIVGAALERGAVPRPRAAGHLARPARAAPRAGGGPVALARRAREAPAALGRAAPGGPRGCTDRGGAFPAGRAAALRA